MRRCSVHSATEPVFLAWPFCAAVGGRVRYLVDTPEVIWGFLDSQQHLSAAQRFLRSQLVHQQLHSKSSRAMLAKFPLLSHQWPVVLKFRCALCRTHTGHYVIQAARWCYGSHLARKKAYSHMCEVGACVCVCILAGSRYQVP